MDSDLLKKAEEVTAERPWVLPGLVAALARPQALLAGFIAVCVLLGYLFDSELMFRPGGEGPATHPFTALCLLGISLVLVTGQRSAPSSRGHAVVTGLLGMMVILMLLYVADQLLGVERFRSIVPFQHRVDRDALLGKSNSMGWNSSLMILLVLAAVTLVHFQHRLPAQALSFIAASVPTVSLTGYAYGLSEFYGEMSLFTALSGLFLSLAVLAITADGGPLRAILSPYQAGRISRIQVVLAASVPGLLGYVMIQFMHLDNADAVGAYVICITWLGLLLVSISALYLDHVDHLRRESERLLVRAAMNDQLTGLPNRRRFFQFGHYEIERASRTDKPLWLLMMDLDSFKRINDQAGHDMGDKVLCAVADAMKASTRSVDLASRLGGEEFAVLLVDASQDGARRVAEAIRRNVEAIQIRGWTDQHGPITVSIGGCEVTQLGSLDRGIKAADKLLYEAKHAGKNRVVTG